jgi:NAD(P)-dependent dehydrogenase (short-subunit alcohol dehydrogenase family)
MALTLAEAGADVALASRNVEALNETATLIQKMGQEALVCPMDISKLDEIEKAVSYNSPYTAAKAGLILFTKTLALEWARYNIQVNALCPGYFLTDLNRDFFQTPAGQKVINKIPVRRVADPGEIRGVTLLLASDASSFMTGSVILVDGGHILG